MRIGLGSLLAAAIVGLTPLAKPAVAEDASLVTYEELLGRVARLEEELAKPPGPTAEGEYDKACGCETCCDTGGWYARYENVIVTPYFSRNTAYSEKLRGVAGIANDQTVVNREFNWELEYSPRFELGYLDSGDGMGWRARYWHFEHSNGIRRRLNDQDVTVEPIDDPDISITIDDGILEVVHGINLRVLDLEFIKQIKDCEGSLTGSVGLRHVRLDHRLTAREINPANGNLIEFINMRHNFEGIGPTVSVEGLKRFDCSNWGAYVNLRGSILYGEADLVGLHDDDATTAAVDEVFKTRDEQDLIPVGEMQIGLDYTRGDWFVRVGLEAQYWINGGSASAQVANDENSASPTETDLGFLGLNIATGLSW